MDAAGQDRAGLLNSGDILSLLAGTWQGEGRGGYPTIATFNYREVLTFERRDQQSLFYTQRTEKRLPGHLNYANSHWESGFIRLQNDGTLEMANIQVGGRSELLVGVVERQADRLSLVFESKSLSNDDRMVATSRVFTLQGESLHYEMNMQTQQVPELARHLEATLELIEEKRPL